MVATEDLARQVGVTSACRSLGVARSTLYHRRRHIEQEAKARPKPPRALSEEERQKVLDVLHSERFMDKSPAQVWATLVDEGVYLCSERSMYRILSENQEVRERRDQLRHPEYKRPELLAQGPNEVWSWVKESCRKQGIEPGQLIIHAELGSPMIAKSTAQLFITFEMVHYGLAEDVIECRRKILETAYRAHPERFVRGVPSPPPLPEAVWINPPVTVSSNRRKLQ